jgi:hypothetical protein
MEHFVYEPKKSTENPQHIPFFLSTRIVDTEFNPNELNATGETEMQSEQIPIGTKNSCALLKQYESNAADFATEFEDSIMRF